MRCSPATGLEAAALRSALAEGNSLASLIEANGGDVADFIAQASTAFNDHVDAAVADGSLSEERAAMLKDGMAERIEALVNAEHEGRDGRGWHQDKDGDAMDDMTFAMRYATASAWSYRMRAANAFHIENTTDASTQVRVEVHLSRTWPHTQSPLPLAKRARSGQTRTPTPEPSQGAACCALFDSPFQASTRSRRNPAISATRSAGSAASAFRSGSR